MGHVPVRLYALQFSGISIGFWMETLKGRVSYSVVLSADFVDPEKNRLHISQNDHRKLTWCYKRSNNILNYQIIGKSNEGMQ